MLSVIVPTHDRRDMVIRLLDALALQACVGEPFEVIVVADGSTDGTGDAIRGGTWPFPLSLVEQGQQGQAAARNHGARMASGDAFVFLDDDVVPAPDFLSHVSRTLHSGADGVLANLKMGTWVPDTLLSREFAGWTRDENTDSRPPPRFDEVLFCAAAIRRSFFEQAGGFDESYTNAGEYGNEDIELGHRLIEVGAVISRQSAAIAVTEPILDPVLVLRRQRAIGRNDVRLLMKYPELRGRVLLEKSSGSRMHRLSRAALRAYPVVVVLSLPLRLAVVTAIRRGFKGEALLRVWSILRAIEYWRGIRDVEGHLHVINDSVGEEMT